ncbi:MAG: SDR family NAD(P)-dependent oxidoreductase [Candidatus Thiodiazotropha sp.]
MIKNFKDKIAVVTGGANGIGRALVKAYLDEGMRVMLADTDQEGIDATLTELNAGDRLKAINVDISTLEANQKLAEETIKQFGAVNIVHLNAALLGSNEGWRASDISVSMWEKTIQINLHGSFYGVRAFLPYLEKTEEAQLVITCSAFSFIAALSDPAPYFASKAALLSYAECLYHDLKDRKSHIGVTAVLPGNTQNGPYEMLTKMLAQTKDHPETWQENVWGDRDYAAELIAMFDQEGNSTPASVVAEATIDAIANDRFYVTENIGIIWKYIHDRLQRFMIGKNPRMLDKNMTVYRPLQSDEM